MVNTYLVSLVERATGRPQSILVRSECADGMQEFVSRSDLDPPLTISDPVVIGIKQLAMRTRLPRTTMSQFVA